MNTTLDALVDRAARGVLLHSEGPALRAAVAALEQHLANEHQTSALRAGIANDLRGQLRAAEDELARLRPLPAQLAAVRALAAGWEREHPCFGVGAQVLAAIDGPAEQPTPEGGAL